MSLLSGLARAATSGLAATWRLDITGDARVAEARRAGPVLFAVWHQQLLPPLWHRRRENILLLVSGHDDARVLRRAARAWGYGVARGSSTRGGAHGLRRLVRAVRDGRDAAITPDGPRGPARVAKQGILAAAALTGAAIVPVSSTADRAWRFRSWDRFTLPGPSARVRVAYGAPLTIERHEPLDASLERFHLAMTACERECLAG